MKRFIVVVVYILFFFIIPAHAVPPACTLDNYFMKTEGYKNHMLQKMDSSINRERNYTSLYPNLYLSSGQYANNNTSFTSIDNSFVTFGLSMPLYSGGLYSKQIKMNDAQDALSFNSLKEYKMNYLLSLFSDVSNYNYLIDQLVLSEKKLKNQKRDIKIASHNERLGYISRFEFDIRTQRKSEIENEILNIKNSIEEKQKYIYYKYKIPKENIKDISYLDILNCNHNGLLEILKEKVSTEKDILSVEHEINLSTLKPSVYAGVNITPKNRGTLSDVRFNKANYSLSISVDVPLNIFFSKSIYDKEYHLSLKKKQLRYDDEFEYYLNQKESSERKLTSLQNELNFLKKNIALKREKVKFTYDRLKKNQDTIIEYYRQQEDLYLSEILMKKAEREIEIYKIYINFIK
ncbi:TolC family protein [Cronobacter sp. EKM101R]|uniref:TolC family protein n=1 Tax=unclassified Cronobacter TaxID=2649764 RepID=UPI0013E9FB9B|nr:MULTISPECIES: TolC family protein [unclassified Cronobacter]KAF6590690.1 TolC family protein [Cronobacter sp. EKM101R]KAF6593167.1 TolC family protein [Cronobacter sp. EKM102R]